MPKENSRSWRFSRQINLSVLIQLVLLASLIIGSWVNLQRQLDLLQHDVTMLVRSSSQFQQKLELLTAQGIAHEYRIRAVEKALTEASTLEKTL
ncbi:MAG: hypothetical protein ACYS1A_03005 [Planctomycetota bacterium]